MKVTFYKYHGAGNDFVIFDNREKHLHLNEETIHKLCHRQFGIGADGLMLVQSTDNADFEMVYYNSDGKLGSMCGNGGRCIADCAFKLLKITGKEMRFLASDGIHDAAVLKDDFIALTMQDVKRISFEKNYTILDTGSPHYVLEVADLQKYPVFEHGKNIRNQEQFHPEGINVNFVEDKDHAIYLRTYERGVENETLACGTGVTAAAIASVGRQIGIFEKRLKTKAGDLFSVTFKKENEDSAQNILLTGPVRFVFKGEIDLGIFNK